MGREWCVRGRTPTLNRWVNWNTLSKALKNWGRPTASPPSPSRSALKDAEKDKHKGLATLHTFCNQIPWLPSSTSPPRRALLPSTALSLPSLTWRVTPTPRWVWCQQAACGTSAMVRIPYHIILSYHGFTPLLVDLAAVPTSVTLLCSGGWYDMHHIRSLHIGTGVKGREDVLDRYVKLLHTRMVLPDRPLLNWIKSRHNNNGVWVSGVSRFALSLIYKFL